MFRVARMEDTALIGAALRARENARADALLVDPLAARLAGARGLRLAPRGGLGWIVRSHLIDQLVRTRVRHGIGLVVNLGAGLDTRAYRLPLPASLVWADLDLPSIVRLRRRRLTGVRPRCRHRAIGLDLEDREARRRILNRLARSGHALALTEGLLIYWTPAHVAALAQDLASAGFAAWITDLVSPATLQWQQRGIGRPLARAGAQLQFAPPNPEAFFRRQGWSIVTARSTLTSAVRFGRVAALNARMNRRAGRDAQVVLLERAPEAWSRG